MSLASDIDDSIFFRSVDYGEGSAEFGGGFVSGQNRFMELLAGKDEFVFSIYVLSGTGRYVDKKGERFPLIPNHFCHFHGGAGGRIEIDKGSGWRVAFVACQLTQPGKNCTCQTLQSIAVLDPVERVFYFELNSAFVDQVERWCRDISVAPEFKLKSCLLRGFEFLVHTASKGVCVKSALSESATLIQRVCELVDASLDGRTQLSEVLASLPISYSRIRVIFQQEKGMSIGKYQIQKRIERASEMLLWGTPIKDVASALGYTDLSAFSKQFKQQCGTSPRKFLQDNLLNFHY